MCERLARGRLRSKHVFDDTPKRHRFCQRRVLEQFAYRRSNEHAFYSHGGRVRRGSTGFVSKA